MMTSQFAASHILSEATSARKILQYPDFGAFTRLMFVVSLKMALNHCEPILLSKLDGCAICPEIERGGETMDVQVEVAEDVEAATWWIIF
ncbi:hypothetical protein [uncultured Mobiluncus sp.]|uniref:hypothetical protein n=1 Tax=uncultured Mobiluncus sp. TaxID=293425 RepID=UPI0026040D48|nr:hypothetical protein [uncultured Mobiluncus sp.]